MRHWEQALTQPLQGNQRDPWDLILVAMILGGDCRPLLQWKECMEQQLLVQHHLVYDALHTLSHLFSVSTSSPLSCNCNFSGQQFPVLLPPTLSCPHSLLCIPFLPPLPFPHFSPLWDLHISAHQCCHNCTLDQRPKQEQQKLRCLCLLLPLIFNVI